jgi:hypothetical protein
VTLHPQGAQNEKSIHKKPGLSLDFYGCRFMAVDALAIAMTSSFHRIFSDQFLCDQCDECADDGVHHAGDDVVAWTMHYIAFGLSSQLRKKMQKQ